MGSGTPLLDVRNVTVTYGRAVLALHGVSLRVDAGASVALLGANGAGKTTLLRAIGGLLRFHSAQISQGSIDFDGRPIAGKEPSSLVAGGIAQSLEGRRIFAELSVSENLRLGAFARHARSAERESEERVFELFPGLREFKAKAAGLLSGGQQQVLAIGRALMARPRLLLLDEPSLGLAPQLTDEIARALRAVAESGTAVLVVDQSTALALHGTDYAYLLETGRIVGEGPTAQLLADDRVRASYLGMTAGHDEVAREARAAS